MSWGVGWRSSVSFHEHRARWLASAAGLVVVALIAVFVVQPPSANQQVQSPLLGHGAPPVSGASVTPSRFDALSRLAGRWVVLNFFATWCTPAKSSSRSSLGLPPSTAAAMTSSW